MFLVANCSPTGSAPCRDFHRKTLIFSSVLMFQTLWIQSVGAIGSWGVVLFFFYFYFFWSKC